MKANILVSIMTIILMSSYLQAETVIKDPVCKTTAECDKLTKRLQAEIEVLKAKGIVNLTNDEFNKYANLKKQLLAAQKVKNKKLDELSALKQQVLDAQKAKTQEAYLKVSKTLDELSGMVK